MIDLHSHILPGIDDGAQNISDSIAMAKQAVKNNISIVAATPHYGKESWQLIKAQVSQLNRNLIEAGLDLTVVSGAELYVDPRFLTDKKEDIPTYNDNGSYCLIEFPMLDLPYYVDEVLFSLKVMGITPIIAHPERYRVVIENPNIIKDWIESGCLIQINSGSVLGLFGSNVKKTCQIMLEHKMVHLMASDAHSTGRRGFNLQCAKDKIVKIIGENSVADLVKANPSRVISGEPILVPKVLSYKRRRFFRFFA